jgi:hypothetical protein
MNINYNLSLLLILLEKFKTANAIFSALLLSSCQKKQEIEEGQLGCGFPALGYILSIGYLF